MSLLGELQKLIEEHGSSSILKERLAFWQDRLDGLEKEKKDLGARLAKSEEERNRLSAQLSAEKAAAGKRNLRSEIQLKEGVYIPVGSEVADYGKGPWCSNCFDTKEKLINVHHKIGAMLGNMVSYKWECPSCKSHVRAPAR